MKTPLSFRVKYGFNMADKATIPETEVEKAIYAQVKGIPVKLGNSYINGRNIIAITPNYHKYTGWNEWYEPESPDDWTQIKRDCPNFDGVLDYYQDRVRLLMSTGRENLIGQGVDLPELETPKEDAKRIDRGGGMKRIGDIM
jgi:hypothetical protein